MLGLSGWRLFFAAAALFLNELLAALKRSKRWKTTDEHMTDYGDYDSMIY
jgi:hypothetical protein